jgi:hypothetical protein
MSLGNLTLISILYMMLTYGITYWITQRPIIALAMAISVGIINLINGVRRARSRGKQLTAGTFWYMFGTTAVFMGVSYVISLLHH